MPQITDKVERKIGERIDITAGLTIAAVPELDVLAKADEDKEVLGQVIKAANLEVKKGLDYGQVEVIVSNSGTDRYGESITMEGIDTKQVVRNPVVLWAHDYSSLPIGRIIKLWRKDGNLMARIQLDYDLYDFANTVYQMILRGTINAVSIGGLIKKFGSDKEGKTDYMVIAELEMVELSVVPVGAHPDALVVSKSLGITPEVLKRQFTEFLQKNVVDSLSDLGDDELNSSITTIEAILAALKATRDQTAPQDNPQTKRVKLITLKRLGGELQTETNHLNKTIKITLKGAK